MSNEKKGPPPLPPRGPEPPPLPPKPSPEPSKDDVTSFIDELFKSLESVSNMDSEESPSSLLKEILKELKEIAKKSGFVEQFKTIDKILFGLGVAKRGLSKKLWWKIARNKTGRRLLRASKKFYKKFSKKLWWKIARKRSGRILLRGLDKLGFGKLFGGGKGGAKGGGAAGVIALAATLIIGTMTAIKNLAEKIMDKTSEVQEVHKKLGNISGMMSAVTSVREVNEFMRNMYLGNEMAASAANLTGQEQRRKDAQFAWIASLNKLENSLLMAGEVFTRRLFHILEPMASTIEGVAEIIEKWFGDSSYNNADKWTLQSELQRKIASAEQMGFDVMNINNRPPKDLFRGM